MTALLFAIELIIELSGAALSYRRRFYGLFVLLGFRAFADILCMAIFLSSGGYWAGVAGWIARAIQYLVLIGLISNLVAGWIREEGASKLAFIASAIGAVLTVKAFILGDTWTHKFFDAEIAAVMSAGVVLCVGWITRKNPLERNQAWIAAGLVVSLAGNGICAMLGARFWYPLPAIAALLIWNWAAWKARMPEGSREIRLDLVPRLEEDAVETLRFGPKSVGFVQNQRMVN